MIVSSDSRCLSYILVVLCILYQFIIRRGTVARDKCQAFVIRLLHYYLLYVSIGIVCLYLSCKKCFNTYHKAENPTVIREVNHRHRLPCPGSSRSSHIAVQHIGAQCALCLHLLLVFTSIWIRSFPINTLWFTSLMPTWVNAMTCVTKNWEARVQCT